MRLKQDKRSHFRPDVVYGKQGEEVKLISENGEILIVEGEAGQRFQVTKDEVTEANVAPAKNVVTNYSKPAPEQPKPKVKKPGSNKQQTLF